MAGRFSAQCSAWVAETKERMVAVRNIAAERVVEIMQTPVAKGGNMPVDTGFLRASLMAVRGDNLPSSRPNPETGAHAHDPGQITLVLAGAKLEDTLTVVYTANYARFQEYGSRGRPGRRFVGLAAQQWQRVVSEACAEVKARASR